MNLAFSVDENYLDGLVGTLAGALRRSRGTPVQALILDCGIRDISWELVERTLHERFSDIFLKRLQLTSEQLRSFNPTSEPTRLNNSSYARLLIPELAPDVDRVLYLDCDLLIDADLRPLFHTPFDGRLVAAVPDRYMPRLSLMVDSDELTDSEASSPTFNSGVLLMDLAAMRRERLVARLLSLPFEKHARFQDQALLNHALHGCWKPLPVRWNRQFFLTKNFFVHRDQRGSNWHFLGVSKPWCFDPADARGVVADFQNVLRSSGWTPRIRGTWRTCSPLWRDSIKATRAFALRSRAGSVLRTTAS